jgi:hypothetical protein
MSKLNKGTSMVWFIGNATRLTSDTSKLLNAPIDPPPHCLHFYPIARSTRKFIKKITHPYPFRFLPCQSTLRLPVLDTDEHSPCCYYAPHPSPLARTSLRTPLAPSHRAHRPLAPIARAGASGARFADHVHYQPDRSKPGADGASGGGAHARRWSWMLVVLWKL